MYKLLHFQVAATIFSLLIGVQFALARVEPPHQLTTKIGESAYRFGGQESIAVTLNEENQPFELNDALVTNLPDAESHARLGRIYYEGGMFDKTIYEFLMASEIDTCYTEIYVKLTTLLGKENKTADTHVKPLNAVFCKAKAQENIESSSQEQIDVGCSISSLSTVYRENNTNVDVQTNIPETINVPDALSKIDEAMGVNDSNDNFTPEVNLGKVPDTIKTLKMNADLKEAKITFDGKQLFLSKDVVSWARKRLFRHEEAKDNARLHLFMINVLMFVTVGLVAYAALNLLPGRANPTKDRLESLRFAASPHSLKKSLSQVKRREANFLRERLYALGQLIVPRSEEARSKMKMELARAGYRHRDAVSIYSGIKVLLALIFMGGFVAVGLAMKMKPVHLVFFSPAIAGLGMYLPILLLRLKTKKRKTAILSGFPDALDLLAVCVDAGLGLDAAIVRVADEIHLANRQLSEEFQLLNLEVRAGKPRPEALHNLGQRTDVEDVQSLVAMLIQADRFGTSIAQSLRVHSDASRTKRKLKAEESAAKTTVKMVFPLLLFILPALFVIVMAPAVLQIIKNMGPK